MASLSCTYYERSEAMCIALSLPTSSPMEIFLTLLCRGPSGSINRLGTLWPWRLITSEIHCLERSSFHFPYFASMVYSNIALSSPLPSNLLQLHSCHSASLAINPYLSLYSEFCLIFLLHFNSIDPYCKTFE